jgi:DNA-binding LacI/PurR family transcriptional regulator
MPRAAHVTIRDVALRAGVSHQTVSRVINNSERVAPDTRTRVLSAIQELDYRPNAIARDMARGRTLTLACFAPNLTDYTFASLIEGAETEARRHGYLLFAASAPDPAAFGSLLEQFISNQRTEGLLVINPYIDERYLLVPGNTPVVFLGACARDRQVSSVVLDERLAGWMAASHILELGHRRIAHISGPLLEDCALDRRAGYETALQSAGLPPGPAWEGDWSATSGFEAVQAWLQGGATFTALFAQNDRMAIGAIRALRQAGKRVPQDVSVIGFDDIPLASYFDPPLTTIRQDTFEMGRAAARLLLQAVEQPKALPQQLRLPPTLVVRASTDRVMNPN